VRIFKGFLIRRIRSRITLKYEEYDCSSYTEGSFILIEHLLVAKEYDKIQEFFS